MENEEVDRGQNSMRFKEKDLFNKRQREQWALSKDYRNKRRRELRLKKSDNQHADNYTWYRQQLNSARSEGIICNHNEVGNLLDTNTSEVIDNMETNIIGTGHSTMSVRGGQLPLHPDDPFGTYVIRMVCESAEVVGAGVGGGSSGNKMPTLEEYGTNLTKLAEERIQYSKSKSDCIAKAEGTYDKKKKQEEKFAAH
ncbi:Uncharacterized protein Fot_56767 [Forsythia ovata]|uniref:Uncharacterized protein n=1 Tax=Forsythia ovata TaxID=205694 RepID=A0ABD1NYE9_9LAMI